MNQIDEKSRHIKNSHPVDDSIRRSKEAHQGHIKEMNHYAKQVGAIKVELS